MGAYIPGMEEHNAVNNDDGFTTGFIGNHGGSSVNLVPPQGYMQDPVEPPMGNTQQMPQMGNTQQMPPMGNTQQLPQMQNTQQMPPVSNQPMPQPEMNAMPQQEMKEEKKSDFRITDPSVIGKKTGADLFEAKNNNNKNVSAILKYVAIGIIVILVIFIILYFTGVFKHDEEPIEDEPIVDTQKEQEQKMFYKLNSTCSNLDENGNFGTDLEPIAGCDTLTCNILNNVVCTEGFCMISDGKTVYSKNCTTGNTNTAEVNAFQAAVNLGDACEALNLNGNLEASFATCENYICTTKVNGLEKSQDCNKNS